MLGAPIEGSPAAGIAGALPRFQAWMGQRGWTVDPTLAGRLEAKLMATAETALEAPWPRPEGLARGVFSD